MVISSSPSSFFFVLSPSLSSYALFLLPSSYLLSFLPSLSLSSLNIFPSFSLLPSASFPLLPISLFLLLSYTSCFLSSLIRSLALLSPFPSPYLPSLRLSCVTALLVYLSVCSSRPENFIIIIIIIFSPSLYLHFFVSILWHLPVCFLFFPLTPTMLSSFLLLFLSLFPYFSFPLSLFHGIFLLTFSSPLLPFLPYLRLFLLPILLSFFLIFHYLYLPFTVFSHSPPLSTFSISFHEFFPSFFL